MFHPSQFEIDRTCPDRWTVTFDNPPINMFVPATIVELGVLMTDLEANSSVKVVTVADVSDFLRPTPFCPGQMRTSLKRDALAMTETELAAMAAAAIIGESNKPKTG